MNLSELANLVEKAVHEHPPPRIIDLCQNHYQPYYHLMYLLARWTFEGNAVELGVSKGYGVSALAYGDPEMRVIGLDLNVSPIYCPDNVEFHLISALPVPDFVEDISILHIDTEHSYGNAKNEFEQYKPHLLPGAVVMFDDLHAMDDGVLKAFYELPYVKIQDDRLHPINGYGVLIYE